MIVNVTKICWMMMKKKFVENRKKYYKMKKKTSYFNYKQLLSQKK